jgi:hypothetical protein
MLIAEAHFANIPLVGVDASIVLTTGHHAFPKELSPLPANFYHAKYVPGLRMAKKADLLIHHPNKRAPCSCRGCGDYDESDSARRMRNFLPSIGIPNVTRIRRSRIKGLALHS